MSNFFSGGGQSGATTSSPVTGQENVAPSPFVTASDGQGLPGFGVGPSRKSPITLQTLLVAVVLVASAGAIVMMRKVGLGNFTPFAMGGEVQVDLSTVPKADTRHVAVIEALNKTRTGNQVAVDQLQKNPFSLPALESVAGQDDFAAARMSEVSAAERARIEREDALRKQFNEMVLNGVMKTSRGPVARVNGRMVHAGDRLGDFTVLEISGRSVLLEADGMQVKLEVSGGRKQP
jgi:hypothetical protein